MVTSQRTGLWAFATLVLVGGAVSAQASERLASFTPSVPVSAFARPAAWLDPSRLRVSTEVMVGTGWGGHGVDGLQVTRFDYRLSDPLALRVSLGSAFGGSATRGGNSFFLEGLDLSYRPFPSFSIQVHYQDFRSPLQLPRPGAYPYWR